MKCKECQSIWLYLHVNIHHASIPATGNGLPRWRSFSKKWRLFKKEASLLLFPFNAERNIVGWGDCFPKRGALWASPLSLPRDALGPVQEFTAPHKLSLSPGISLSPSLPPSLSLPQVLQTLSISAHDIPWTLELVCVNVHVRDRERESVSACVEVCKTRLKKQKKKRKSTSARNCSSDVIWRRPRNSRVCVCVWERERVWPKKGPKRGTKKKLPKSQCALAVVFEHFCNF